MKAPSRRLFEDLRTVVEEEGHLLSDLHYDRRLLLRSLKRLHFLRYRLREWLELIRYLLWTP